MQPRAAGFLGATVALLAVAVLLPSAGAQGHEHGVANANIAIAHDAPADGRTFVGNVNHFAIIAHGDDAVPDFHQNVPWRVTLGGVTLVETTPDSGHDYDGVNAFDIVFPGPGDYTVEALDESGKAVAVFAGRVEPAAATNVTACIRTTGESTESMAGQPTHFAFEPATADDEGGIIAHSDCTFEVARSGRVEFRTKLHTHEETQELDYAFPEAGAYEVRILCFQAYPSRRATLFQPVLLEWQANVLPGVPGNAGGLSDLPPVAPPTAMNAVVTAPVAEGMTLVGTYDPYVQVGPDTLQHLNVLAVDGTGQTIQHVDFTATLDGPLGRIFASDTLHEYDGIYDLVTRQSVPGIYTLRVTAEGGKGEGALAMSYVVLPRAAPLSVGLVDVALDASAITGTPGDWLLTATTTTGAFAHGELEIRLTAESATIPFLQTKLHTHDDGLYLVTVALPTNEPYTLEVTPFPLTPDLVLTSPATFEIEPAQGTALVDDPADVDAPAEQEMPGPPLAALLGLLALALVLVRRRA